MTEVIFLYFSTFFFVFLFALMRGNRLMSRKLTSLACMLAIGLLCSTQVAPTRAAVISGSLTDFNSSADLDLSNVIYAVNLGSGTDQTVGSVTFSGGSPAGFTQAGGGGSLPIPTAADLDGGGSAEDALEAVLADSTFATDGSLVFTFDTDKRCRLSIATLDVRYGVFG